MRAAVWVGVLVGFAGCSSQQEPPRPNAICPAAVRDQSWARELFPGCPPAPFNTVGIVCDGACPRPCHAFFTSSEGEVTSARFDYDADGRWIRTRSAPTLRSDGDETHPDPRPGKRYCGGTGRHRECEVASPHNRLDDDYEVADYTVDASGNVIEVAPRHDSPARFTYDGRRLMTEREPDDAVRKYHYDARGRIGVIEATGGYGSRITYVYDDATNRLARTVQRRPEFPDHVTAFAYDDRGRPVTITDSPDVHPTIWRYVYECPTLPFTDAMATMHGFRARACACGETDTACKGAIYEEAEAWGKGVVDATHYAPADDTQRGPYNRLVDDTLACLGQLGW